MQNGIRLNKSDRKMFHANADLVERMLKLQTKTQHGGLIVMNAWSGMVPVDWEAMPISTHSMHFSVLLKLPLLIGAMAKIKVFVAWAQIVKPVMIIMPS